MKTILISAFIAAVLTGCAGYVPGRQTYWDAQVREMCAKDSKLIIYEKVILTKHEASLMPKNEGKIATRSNSSKTVIDPIYSEIKIIQINESNPRVTREDVEVIRRKDQKIVARWTDYSRVGGDLPTGLAHSSSFVCPDPRRRLEELQQLFLILED